MTRFLYVPAVAMVTLLIATCAQANDLGPKKMTAAQIEATVKRQLPVGSSRDHVVSFLDKQGIEHSGHSVGAPSEVIYAIFRNVQGNTLTTSKSVQVIFHFTNQRLSDYSFKELFTGPYSAGIQVSVRNWGHVWTAPCIQGFSAVVDRWVASHVSGLLMRCA
jgi:hypothetical protein